MISAFQSREFGFGLDLSEAQIEKVNQEWRGKKYKNEESAINMLLHFEDVVDCLKVTYPQYDYLFMFDHSCGHDKQRENGLNVQQMSKLFGGKTTNHERYRYGQM